MVDQLYQPPASKTHATSGPQASSSGPRLQAGSTVNGKLGCGEKGPREEVDRSAGHSSCEQVSQDND